MFKVLRLLFIVGSVVFFLAGCAKKAPTCSDEKTVNLVKQIVIKDIHDIIEQDKSDLNTTLRALGSSSPKNANVGFLDNLSSKLSSQIQIAVNTITASSYDEKIDKYSCEAELVINLPPNLQKTIEDIKNRKPDMINSLFATKVFGLKWVDRLEGIDEANGNAVRTRISYSSQLTDSKDEQLVEARGIHDVTSIVATVGGIDSLSNYSPKKNQDAPSPTAAPTEQSQSESSILSKYKVSFDCNKALTTAEKLTCSTPILGQLDGLLSATYKERSNDPSFGVDKKLFKADQTVWAKKKDMCGSVDCVEKSYRDRISELCGMPAVSGAHPVGEDCEAIHD